MKKGRQFMKKILCLFLSIILIILALSGCSESFSTTSILANTYGTRPEEVTVASNDLAESANIIVGRLQGTKDDTSLAFLIAPGMGLSQLGGLGSSFDMTDSLAAGLFSSSEKASFIPAEELVVAYIDSQDHSILALSQFDANALSEYAVEKICIDGSLADKNDIFAFPILVTQKSGDYALYCIQGNSYFYPINDIPDELKRMKVTIPDDPFSETVPMDKVVIVFFHVVGRPSVERCAVELITWCPIGQ